MRFQKSTPPPAFGGRDRVMVFLFLGALAVVFAVKLGSNPKFWKALRGEPGQEVSSTGTASSLSTSIDPSVLRPDENRFAPPGSDNPSVFGDRPRTEVTIEGAADLSIPTGDLKSVRDNTMGIRTNEVPAYYAALQYARGQSPSDMSANAKDIPYTMLMAEPWAHRGKLISIEGRLRRLVPIKAGVNSAGIEQLYDAWVFTKDSGSSPVHVICSAIPIGLQPAEIYQNDPPEVTLTGYFFKTQGYQSVGDGTREATLHTAPLVLAGGIAQVPVVQTKTRDIASEMVPWLWWFAIGVGVILIMVLWNFAASDWAFRHTRAHGLVHPQPTAPDFYGVDALTTQEMLYEFARESYEDDYRIESDLVYSEETVGYDDAVDFTDFRP